MTPSPQSVLPPTLREALATLGDRLQHGQPSHELNDVLHGLATLPLYLVVRADREIASAVRWGWSPHRRGSWLGRVLRGSHAATDLLTTTPELAWLFLFDFDGRIREAALEAIQAPPPAPFFFVALAWRLNDWAVPVRAAAVRCCVRVLPGAAPPVAARSALFLLDRRLAWGRWRNEQQVLDRVFGQPDVIAVIADLVREGPTGALAACLRHALRYPAIDGHLQRLATKAVQPAVRAVAFRCLIARRATWIEGFTWIWADKIYGIRKRVANLGSRDISVQQPLAALIAQGTLDRSPAVRKVAADALIEFESRVPDAAPLIARLANDRNAAVRARADFMLRRRGKSVP